MTPIPLPLTLAPSIDPALLSRLPVTDPEFVALLECWLADGITYAMGHLDTPDFAATTQAFVDCVAGLLDSGAAA